MLGRTNAGGGGAALNFKIIPYATEEALQTATPTENTIGVITETKITSWIFAASEPAEPVEGMLWIVVGSSSPVGFNALKKNTILICPLAARQYVDGGWTDVTAKIYQNGAWADWGVIVFDRRTGDYDTIASHLHTVYSASTALIADETTHVKLYHSSDSTTYKAWQWDESFDFSQFTKLVVAGYASTESAYFGVGTKLYSNSSIDGVASVASKKFSLTESELELDVSGISGMGYIGFVSPKGATIHISSIKLM